MGRLILILLIHLIADFFLQSNNLSRLKAFKIPFLFEHVGIYTLVFIVLSPLVLGLTFLQGLAFSLINGVFHLAIDDFTGKLKSKYFKIDESKYMAVIGLDHTLHLIILIITYLYIFPNAMNSPYLMN